MEERPKNISRRDFLKGLFGVAIGGAGYVAEKKFGLFSSLLNRLNRITNNRSTEIVLAQDQLKQETEQAPKMTAVFMCNERGESIKAYKQERNQYEAWSLIKVPLALMILQDANEHPELYRNLTFQGSFDWQTRLFDHMLHQSDNGAFRDFSIWMHNRLPQVKKVDIKSFTNADWKTISQILAKSMREQFGLSNDTMFDPNQEALGLYMTTPEDMVRCMQQIIKPSVPINPDHIKKMKEALVSQSAKTRFEYYKTLPNNKLENSTHYHKIGNGYHDGDLNSYSYHDAGIIEFPDGKYLAFCIMNDHQTEIPETTLNTRFVKALDTGLRILCGIKSTK